MIKNPSSPVSADSFPVWNLFAAACVRVPVDHSLGRWSRNLFFCVNFFFSLGNVALQSTSVETTFGYFSCATRQTKAHFGPSKCFSLGSRATDAQPYMVRGSAAGTSQPSTTVGNIAITSWPHDPWTGVARPWVVWKKSETGGKTAIIIKKKRCDAGGQSWVDNW